MAPTIHYAHTEDGVSIAFTTTGEGLPLVFIPPVPFSHIEAVRELPGAARFLDALSRHAQLAVYDGRGTGLSDRDALDFSLDAMQRDLEAVVRALGWRQFAVCGFFNAAPAAIAYAAAHPEAVTHLVLWGAFAHGAEIYPLPFAAPAEVSPAHWTMLVETAARVWTAGDHNETRDTAAYFRAAVEPMAALRAFTAAREYDVRPLLGRVRARTLVVHRRDATGQRLDLARAVASGIADAELSVLAGDAASPFSGDVEAGVAAIEAFLGIAAETPGVRPAASTPPVEALTQREIEVLRLVAGGLANKEIASELGLSVHTVERHLTNLYPKIGCRSRSEATAFALTHGYS